MTGPTINQLIASQPVVTESGEMLQQMRTFTTQVTEQSLIIGTGSPEGVIPANQGRRYMDDDGSTGSLLYIKKLAAIGGDDTQGWALV